LDLLRGIVMARCTCKPGDPCEACFQQQVTGLARLCGWEVWHTHDSRRSREGWPDLAIVRGGRALFREAKRRGGELSKHQSRCLCMLSEAGLDAEVWRPADWPLIERTLA